MKIFYDEDLEQMISNQWAAEEKCGKEQPENNF